MFRLVVIEDVIQVPPSLFSMERFDAMELVVNRKYSNTVLSGVGVCVSLWDWVEAGDDRLMPHTGDANTGCKFRLLVFAPMQGEVLWGHINKCHGDGVTIDMDFIGGIEVARAELPGVNHELVTNDEGMGWKFVFPPEQEEAERDEDVEARRVADVKGGAHANGAGAEGGADAGEGVAGDKPVFGWIDAGNTVAFAVLKVVFTDGVDKPPEDPKTSGEPKTIMTIQASMKRRGLGRREWWDRRDAEAPDGARVWKEGGEEDDVVKGDGVRDAQEAVDGEEDEREGDAPAAKAEGDAL
jgi:DNA-directed RNA polymerase subunit E'/Rpb7